MPFSARTCLAWRLPSRTLPLGERTVIMGILNVTPDSFSDGGRHAGVEAAARHAVQMLDAGAAIVDVGGESTRPGSPARTPEAISAEEEQSRVLPVIEAVLRQRPGALISVDTYRASTARAAVVAGAQIVNDVSGGLWDAGMLRTCAELRCGVVLMHTRGLPSQWAQQEPLPADAVTPVVLGELLERTEAAVSAGIERERILIDPGLGFGKRGAENWALLRNLDAFARTGFPLLVGLSRKGFLSAGNERPEERDGLTHTADALAVLQGAHMLRVHDVPGAVRSAGLVDAVLHA